MINFGAVMRKDKLQEGIYEEIVNKNISELIKKDDFIYDIGKLNKEDSSKILANYMANIIRNGLDRIHKNENNKSVDKKINIINKLINVFTEEIDTGFAQELIPLPANQLFSVTNKLNNITTINDKVKIERPATSLANSFLFTGANNDKQLFSEIKKEIISCNKIDILVSFIKVNGLNLIIEQLKDFVNKGGKIRVITTTYMKATDKKAIEILSQLKNIEIKINYNEDKTRLHAKAFIFHRDTGFSTAYVGSSNISVSAMTNGLEWNMKITQKDMPDIFEKMKATFDTYWNNTEFITYDNAQETKLAEALNKKIENKNIYTLDVRPYPFQQEILDAIQADRKIRNQYKNLIVAATGTGKTVISALDYKRYCEENPKKNNRLLFVAHRKEILEQSINTYRAVLKNNNFGELLVGYEKPTKLDYLFASTQSIESKEFTSKIQKDFYDYIVIDETHHISAKTYQSIINHFIPHILLGLTATPERADGSDILKFFNDKITAEIRLPEAIEKNLLCPFYYFGVTDNVDLSSVKWERGKYNIQELNNIYTINEKIAIHRAEMVINSVYKYLPDLEDVKGLGFCVSKEHAKFMSFHFNNHNIKSIALTADSDKETRETAKNKLLSGEYKFIFVVDIYNEGVDIPEVNTVLFLRPTESLTIFLQQLGRGLRLSKGKEVLTVLDFIGQANKKYNFEEKFISLLHKTKRNIVEEINNDFPSLPKGCYITLEKLATKHILNNIKEYYRKNKAHVIGLANFKKDTGLEPTLSNYLTYYKVEPGSIYKKTSFNKLLVSAGIIEEYKEPLYENDYKILMKLSQINSVRFIDFIIKILTSNMGSYSEIDKRMLQMFQFTINFSTSKDITFNEMEKNLLAFKENTMLCKEIVELLEYNKEHIDFIYKEVDLNFSNPLDVYCNYSKEQILAAYDFFSPSSVQEGVKYIEDKKIDLFFVTLNKSEKNYTPTTMYKDFSLNEKLFHWQSQNKISETSTVGNRYINHKNLGSKILLFIRDYKTNKYGTTETYTFLGTANYKSHEGNKPMSIILELDYPIPARFINVTNMLAIV